MPTADGSRGALAGRVALVTGASRGIGSAAAVALALAGARVVVGFRSGEQEAGAVVAEIEQTGGEAIAAHVDVADPESVAALFERISEFGDGMLDILFANAGIYPTSPVESLTSDEWDAVFAVNARGTFLCCRSALPLLRRSAAGRIVTIASNTVERAPKGTAAYAASKGAVIAFTRVLARELGHEGITVNCLVPSLVETAAADRSFAAAIDVTVAAQAIPRRQQPEDLNGALVFLASDASAFITGQTINADGGLFFR